MKTISRKNTTYEEFIFQEVNLKKKFQCNLSRRNSLFIVNLIGKYTNHTLDVLITFNSYNP